MVKDVLTAIESRRSIRKFKSVLTPQELLEKVLLAVTLSIGVAIQNMLLAAESLGLGSLWICDIFFAYDALHTWLGTEGQMLAAISLGYPDEFPDKRPRKNVDDVTVSV